MLKATANEKKNGVSFALPLKTIVRKNSFNINELLDHKEDQEKSERVKTLLKNTLRTVDQDLLGI